MDPVYDDRFVVFVRLDRSPVEPPGDAVEQPLASCSTYAEARLIRRTFHDTPGELIIRYVGPAGGGD
jgi:hypothetical protein